MIDNGYYIYDNLHWLHIVVYHHSKNTRKGEVSCTIKNDANYAGCSNLILCQNHQILISFIDGGAAGDVKVGIGDVSGNHAYENIVDHEAWF